jgi:hypothetical protein
MIYPEAIAIAEAATIQNKYGSNKIDETDLSGASI